MSAEQKANRIFGKLRGIGNRTAILALILIATTVLSFQNCTGFMGSLSEMTSNASLSSNIRSAGNVRGTKFGIFYLFWHCLAQPTYDISRVLGGQEQWGPLGAFHWWSQPQLGYYCPTRDRSVLRRHAEQLRDAGIDFVYLDITNFSRNEGQAITGAVEPLRALIEEWKTVPGAPKIAVWMPFLATGDLHGVVDAILGTAPELLFQFKGKPLMLVVASPEMQPDPGIWHNFEQKYTLRKMWAYVADPNGWSFMEACQPNFKASGGNGPCNQRVAYGPDGQVEQVSVTAAYQNTYMTNFATAVPKFGGKTLQAQMRRIDDFDDPPIVTITGWNEWIAQRFCVGPRGAPSTSCAPNAASAFVDQWDAEYSRDIEPGGATGDFYYNLMKSEILGRKHADQRITGWLDRAYVQNNNVVIEGWACNTNNAAQVDVHIYVGGQAGGGGTMMSSGKADKVGEPAIAERCSTPDGNHRFQIVVDNATARANTGKAIFAHGISVVGGANLAVPNSGNVVMPDPGTPIVSEPIRACSGTRPAGSILHSTVSQGSSGFHGVACGGSNGNKNLCASCSAHWIYDGGLPNGDPNQVISCACDAPVARQAPRGSCGGSLPSGSILHRAISQGSNAFGGLACGTQNGNLNLCGSCGAHWVYDGGQFNGDFSQGISCICN